VQQSSVAARTGTRAGLLPAGAVRNGGTLTGDRDTTPDVISVH
jgi:hypothetical protein